MRWFRVAFGERATSHQLQCAAHLLASHRVEGLFASDVTVAAGDGRELGRRGELRSERLSRSVSHVRKTAKRLDAGKHLLSDVIIISGNRRVIEAKLAYRRLAPLSHDSNRWSKLDGVIFCLVC